jgi:excisionase family DNA binding protein
LYTNEREMKNMETATKRYMTPKEINKEYLGISEVKLYEILNKPGCPKINIGRRYLLNVEKFLDWLENQSA